MREFDSYIRANAGRIPNYGERRRAGEAISTAFAESTVNQVISKRMVKKQQMRWTPRGAHLLLQIRTRVLNDHLADDFRRWYPGFNRALDPVPLAVSLPRFVPLSRRKMRGADIVMDYRADSGRSCGVRQGCVSSPGPGGRYSLHRCSLPGIGLPMRATGIQKHIWPITIVSVHSALVS